MRVISASIFGSLSNSVDFEIGFYTKIRARKEDVYLKFRFCVSIYNFEEESSIFKAI